MERTGGSVLKESKRVLLDSGFPADRIQCKVELGREDPAEDILKRAEAEGIGTIALGRRGRSRVGSFLLGSVSCKVAHYSGQTAVWIVDTPISESQKVLVAVEGAPDCQILTQYAKEFLGSIPDLQFTLLHLLPPVPPAYWDHGRILSSGEKKTLQTHLEKYQSQWTEDAENYMAEGKNALIQKGVRPENVTIRIVPTHMGIARDLLNEIDEKQYKIVLIGKKSFREKTPFLLGSRANKILHKARGVILCMLNSL
jgi:nucleotide-binding universal stress UspA family protein